MSHHPPEGVEEHPTRRIDPMGPSVLSRKSNSRIVAVRRSNGEDEQTDPSESGIGVVKLLLILSGKDTKRFHWLELVHDEETTRAERSRSQNSLVERRLMQQRQQNVYSLEVSFDQPHGESGIRPTREGIRAHHGGESWTLRRTSFFRREA